MNSEQEVKDYLRDLITEAMYMEKDELKETELFSDFGLESVTLVKIVAKIAEKYSLPITANELIAHQTLNCASKFVHEKLVSHKIEAK